MEGLTSLGINLPVLIAQIINFGLLFLLLRMVAYKPLMKMFDERARKIKESIAQREHIQEEAARAEEEARVKIEQASRDGQEIIARALKTGEEAKQRGQEEAKQEADGIITRARSEIQRERDEAIDALRGAFADVTIRAAEKVINKSLDKKAHRELIEETLEESTSLNKN